MDDTKAASEMWDTAKRSKCEQLQVQKEEMSIDMIFKNITVTSFLELK